MLIVLFSQPDQFVASGCVRAHKANVKFMIEENFNSSFLALVIKMLVKKNFTLFFSDGEFQWGVR